MNALKVREAYGLNRTQAKINIRKAGGYIFILMGLLALGCGGLLAGFDLGARNPNVYTSVQKQAAVDAQLDVDIAVLRDANRDVAAYMVGDAPELALSPQSVSALGQGFSQRERLHMQDVRDLFALQRRAMIVAWVVGVVFTLAGLHLADALRWKMLLRCTKMALGVWIALVAGLAVVIALDFDSAFITFHHLLFTNDLWLLSAQDLLIRMYPQNFFEGIALKLSLYMLGGFVCVYAILEALGLLGRYISKGEKRA